MGRRLEGGPMTQVSTPAKSAPEIRHVDADSEVAACYELMRQLRPHLASELELIERWRRQADVGYRVQDNLRHGPHLYVDDLVTDEVLRSCGHGHALMERLKAEARALGCAKLILDTPLTNTLGHRFYYREGL